MQRYSKTLVIFLVALILAVTIISIIHISKAKEVEFFSAKDNFKADEDLIFRFKYRGGGDFKNLDIRVTVFNYKGEEVAQLNPDEHYENGEISVDLTEYFKQIKPGKYRLKFEIEDKNNGKTYVENKDFTWGVLAINVNKSIYLVGERAYLQVAALRDDGRTICDANLKLEIISPSGGSTSATVEKSGKCGPDNVTDVPDYFAYYQVEEPGVYQIKLINLDNGYEIEDSFEVRKEVPFDIERIGPTRIYPPAEYEMRMVVKVNEDFRGEVAETVPASFELKSQNSNLKTTTQNPKLIVWQVDWRAGETHELKYQFDAPDISPYLYLLGPLRLADARSGQAIFEEIRQWQIAADQTTTKQFIISGTADDPVAGGTEFSNLMGDGNQAWNTAENARRSIIPTSGKLSNFKVQVKTAPGAGNSWTFTIRISGSNSNLAVTISDTNTISSLDTDEVTVSAGDDTSILAASSGTPTAAAAVYWTVQFTPDISGETILLGNGNGTAFAVNNFRSLVGSRAQDTTQWDVQIVFPTSGTLKKLYFEVSAAPGAGTSKQLIVRKNGVDTSLAVTISDTNTTGNDTVNTVSITAGDMVNYSQVVTGSPAAAYSFYGIVFVPDTPGEYIAAAVTDDATLSTAVEYQHLTCADSDLNSTENEFYNLAQETTAKAIYVNLTTAPSAGYTWTFTLRDDGADTALALSISDTNNSGNYATDVSIGADSVLDTAIDATAGTLTSKTQISYLFYNAPTSANNPPTGSINSASQRTDGTGDVDISIEVDDADDNDTKAKIEYDTDGSCDGPWNDATLDETEGATADYNDSGGSPSVVNTDTYQVGTTATYRIITSSGSNTVQFVWNSATDAPSGDGTYCLRLTVNDDTEDQTTPDTQTLTIDNVNPSAPGNLTDGGKTNTTVTLTFGSQSSDTNEPATDAYKIFYKQGASGVTESDSEHNDSVLNSYNYQSASSTTVTGLNSNTQYVFNIWAYDAYGNKANATEVSITTLSGPPTGVILKGSTRIKGGVRLK